MPPSYSMPPEKKEFKEDPYASQAFAPGLGLGFFPKGEDSEATEPKRIFNIFLINFLLAYGGGASFNPY